MFAVYMMLLCVGSAWHLSIMLARTLACGAVVCRRAAASCVPSTSCVRAAVPSALRRARQVRMLGSASPPSADGRAGQWVLSTSAGSLPRSPTVGLVMAAALGLAGAGLAMCCGGAEDGFASNNSLQVGENVSAAAIADAARHFRSILGDDGVSMDEDELVAHGNDDHSYHTGERPHIVVYPASTADVSAVLKYCNDHRLPVIPYGSGTSLEGHTTAPFRGVCVDMSQMSDILQVRPGDLDATVQAGVPWGVLNDHLAETKTGLFFPMDPGPGASIGGMVGTGCSGTNAVRYGTMKANVLNLTVVLADGTVVKTAQRARKSSAGYDLTSLFVGSEGTLGMVTEVTVKLAHVPEETVVATCSFDSIHNAASAVHMVMKKGVPIGCVELLDDDMMRALNLNSGSKHREAPTVFFKLTGSTSSVKESARIVEGIVKRHGGGHFQWTADAAKKQKLWSARKTALWAAPALKEGSRVWTTDVCVPLSSMAECIAQTKADIKRSWLPAPLVGHAGDGNFHVLYLIDPDEPRDLAEAKRLNDRMIQRAMAMGGTCTGEHGVGVGKKKYLRRELGDANVHTMWLVKRALDPNGIMNPGKLLPDPLS